MPELLEQVRRTGEPIELTKRGKPLAIVSPPPVEYLCDYTHGKFKDTVRKVRSILVDSEELGV